MAHDRGPQSARCAESARTDRDAWLKKYLGNYIQLAVAERYDVVVAAKEAGLSNRQIAKAAEVDHKTIGKTLKDRGEKSPHTPPKPRKMQETQQMGGEKSPQAAR